MKKLKGVAATDPDPSPNAVPLEDPRGRFKFQSLLQDYEDLLRETDAMNRKMLIMKQRKMILQAEVRFLRQRSEFLTENNNPLHLKRSQDTIKGKPQVSENKSKRNVKKQNCPARRADGVGDPNKKSRIENAKKAKPRIPKSWVTEKGVRMKGMGHQKLLPDFDLNQGDSVPIPMKNSGLDFDLNQKERNQTGMEALILNRAPIFDLNQISRDEVDLPNNNAEPIGTEEAIRSSVQSGNEEQLNSVKLPGCWTSGNGSDRAGKRKITWEDQVALKV